MRRQALVMAAVSIAALAALIGCATTPTQEGALLGGALGAGAGAIIGNQSHGRGGEGALIGGAVGALTGALVGDQVDEARTKRAAPPAAPAPPPTVVQRGHYENRIVRTPSGETYEERVWVPER